MQFNQQAIPVAATLDVQVVERELNRLWTENTEAASSHDETAVLRARVLNLMVYVTDEASLDEVNNILALVSATHPCRVLVMLAETNEPDRDIEMFVSAYCQSSSGEHSRHLCCEHVMLRARGQFAVELPSAATPLLVPDLPVFLWWRDVPRLSDPTFLSLCRASDRVIIDSADFTRPYQDLLSLREFLRRAHRNETRLSDLNWARLTSWRMLLASFYDVPEYRAPLERINRVRIEYVAHALAPQSVAPKALLLAGWLASRLNWRVRSERAGDALTGDAPLLFVEKEGRAITFEFHRVERRESMQGWVARVELGAETESRASFTVSRSEDGRHLETIATLDNETRASRTLTGGDLDEAGLLRMELAILDYDRIYEQAIDAVADMLTASSLASSEPDGDDKKD
jgi:glucose-6-phosphate dehydrogenase assembly protein OpcA